MELKVNGARIFAATGGRPFDPAFPAVLFLHGAGMDAAQQHGLRQDDGRIPVPRGRDRRARRLTLRGAGRRAVIRT